MASAPAREILNQADFSLQLLEKRAKAGALTLASKEVHKDASGYQMYGLNTK